MNGQKGFALFSVFGSRFGNPSSRLSLSDKSSWVWLPCIFNLLSKREDQASSCENYARDGSNRQHEVMLRFVVCVREVTANN